MARSHETATIATAVVGWRASADEAAAAAALGMAQWLNAGEDVVGRRDVRAGAAASEPEKRPIVLSLAGL